MPCASCRSALPPDARFCPFCGSPCAPGPVTARPTGRKVVTVLFCDLVGSTALSGALDAETLRSVTLRWFDLMRLRIEEQGGTVEKFIGDAVMAVFGVPTVREDDARRAASAALAMREALTGFNARLEEAVGVRLDMRIGINTGQAVTGSSTLRQAMVSGEVVNIAARLEQNAAAGEILIGPDTLAAAGPGVRTTETGPLLLKGKSDRVAAHRLMGLDEEDGPEALRRFDLGFVGRTRELDLIDAALEKVIRSRRVARLVVGGEAGQGKTRLVREWLHRAGHTAPAPASAPATESLTAPTPSPTSASLTAPPTPGTTRPTVALRHGVGRCRARGEQPSLGPLADAVADLLKTAGTSAPSPELDLLHQGLLLDGTPNPSPADTCAALAKVLAELAGTGPVVLVIDDCHWAAQPLFDALDRLLRALADAAVLIVLLTRPQLFDLRPELAPDTVLLGGLPDAEAQLLAAELTGRTADSEPLAAEVLARVGGNPLHLEQLLVAGDPVDADSVPLPLQALIGARIDALEPPEQRALGLASVLGGDFTADELTALAGPAETWTGSELRTTLHRLVRHRLIRPDGAAFRFAGGLIQEVVHTSQSKQDRADRHERAARLDTVRRRGSAAVGAHLEQAHRYRVELGAQDAHTDGLRRRAADALAEAGRLALAHADPVWAADLLTRATARYTVGEPGSTTARRRLGQTLLDLGRGTEGRTLLEAVLAESPADGADPVEAAHARLGLASVGRSAAVRPTGPQESPAEAADATLPVFAAAGDELGQARACLRLAQRAQEQGRHREAERLLTRALDHAVRADAEPERAAALGATGVSLWRGPQPVAEAVARCRALLAEQGSGRRAVRLTLNCPLAVVLALHDDRDGALACLAEAEHLAKRLGYAEADAFLPIFTATVAELAGRREDALLSLERAAAAARELGATGLLRSALLDATRIRLDLGDWRTALATLAEPELAGERSDPARPRAESADLDGLRARLAAVRGHGATASRLAARSVATAARTDSPIVQGLAALDLARTSLALGHPGEAAEAAARARLRFAAKGHLPAVREAEAVAAVSLGHGRPPGYDPADGRATGGGRATGAGKETSR
ncbi:adenylate/guanylate cyclase domain-containing protein [Streptomyces sp. NPDC017254]|uniref:adenylate/guanylate cyclase domain-containing protein n=1 Tax=unclassified Streptomyces TaxID=2593676 RepID=UPI0037B8BC80